MLKTTNSIVVDNFAPASSAYDHAVVIGSGIAGLTAVHVLSDDFNQVTII